MSDQGLHYLPMTRSFGSAIFAQTYLPYTKNVYSVFTDCLTGGLFHYRVVDEAVCHFGVSGLFWRFYSFFFLMENPVSKQCRP